MSLFPSARQGRFDPAGTGATSVPRRRVGINVLNVTYDGTALRTLKKLGITRVRVTLQWRLWTGSYLAQFDAMVTELQANGISVLVVVHTPPVGLTLAQGIAQMPAFVAARASAHPGCTWQILNEQNINDGITNAWFDTTNGAVTMATRGTQYATLLGPVYDAVKAADATAKVVIGGTFIDETTYIVAVLAGAPGKCDAVCAQAYGDPLYQAPGVPPHQGQFVLYAQRLRPLVGAIPIWITETGYNSAVDAAQSMQLGLVFKDNDGNTRWDQVYVYALVSGADNFGIARADGTLRESALLFSERTAT
jgi:hypothetical protein